MEQVKSLIWFWCLFILCQLLHMAHGVKFILMALYEQVSWAYIQPYIMLL